MTISMLIVYIAVAIIVGIAVGASFSAFEYLSKIPSIIEKLDNLSKQLSNIEKRMNSGSSEIKLQ